MFVFVACGTSPATEPTAGSAAEPAVESAAPGRAGYGSDCDTAFVFATAQPPAGVLEAMRAARLRPVETRFGTPGSSSGSTGGGIGSPGHVGTIEAIESGLETIGDMHGVEPVIIGIRVRGDVPVEALGSLGDAVHTRTLVPTTSAVALAPPDVDGDAVNVVGGATCGA